METGRPAKSCTAELRERRPAESWLIHHSGRGVGHVSVRRTERLAEAGGKPSVGSVGAGCDDAPAETIGRPPAESLPREEEL